MNAARYASVATMALLRGGSLSTSCKEKPGGRRILTYSP